LQLQIGHFITYRKFIGYCQRHRLLFFTCLTLPLWFYILDGLEGSFDVHWWKSNFTWIGVNLYLSFMSIAERIKIWLELQDMLAWTLTLALVKITATSFQPPLLPPFLFRILTWLLPVVKLMFLDCFTSVFCRAKP
jgi:hypothetical protein